MSKKFELNIITPTDTFNYSDVEYLRAPSIDGLFGVLSGHISSIIALDVGEVKIVNNNKSIRLATSGGFADINEKNVTLVLETAEEAINIDIKRANESIDRAKIYINDKSTDIKRALNSIKRAKNRIRISKKKKLIQ
jgi:F-type H+-transporting ATPase subunit epsilon